MASATFSKAMTRVLAYEGGYSNHPRDPGGVTLEGVIQRVYDAYRKRKGLSLRPLGPEMRKRPDWIRERNEIYRLQYWDKIRGDELPEGVDFVVFDGAVNSGPVQSIKWLQRALKIKNVDGELGEATMAAVDACKDHDKLIADICERRMAFLQQLKTWDTFGVGWSKRVTNVKAAGQAWASGSVGPKPVAVSVTGGDAKGDPRDVAEAPVSVGQTGIATTAGTIVGGAVDQLQTVTATIQPVADTLHVIKYVVLALTLVCAGFMLYGIWRSYKAQRALNGEDKVAVPTERAA